MMAYRDTPPPCAWLCITFWAQPAFTDETMTGAKVGF